MTKHISISEAELKKIKKIEKRDKEIVPFDLSKIIKAVLGAFTETNEGGEKQAELIAKKVLKSLLKLERVSKEKEFIPTVEMIQDLVEEELMYSDFAKTAKAYIIYRQKHDELRRHRVIIPKQVKDKINANSKYFAGSYNEFIFYRTYSKWVEELGRRETWEETIDRFIEFMQENLGKKLSPKDYEDVRQGILKQEVCPSMRLLWSSGEACRKSNVWAYNCSFMAPTKWQDFGEAMYILMCGAGLGFSVESQTVQKFPQIKKQDPKKKPKKIVVPDSKEGWADAFIAACKTWADGGQVYVDYSKIRPQGARLKTAGGRASGPAPLMELMDFTKEKILAKQGRRLTNIDVHDIMCKIGAIVVAGGVRRSALISLSDLDDRDMRHAKTGQFWLEEPQRSMANNSAVYENKPSMNKFLDEWIALMKSGTGERGIFNRGGLETQLPERRWLLNKDQEDMGTNPCGEIVLRSKQFCNLTSIVVRPNDSLEDLKRKVRLATILGTYQASLTNFGYLSKEWKKNCEEEALLGVSITGYYDNRLIRQDKTLQALRKEAISTNKKYAKKIGINESTCITTIKPHGNSGQLLNVGSGMHPWYAPYFIRRVRINASDPLAQLLMDENIPVFPEVGFNMENTRVYVFEFPVKAPNGAIMKDDVSALDLLEEWKRIKLHYVEHNPSVTIYVGDDEWLEVANFLYQNWDIVGGLSFLPRSDHVYQLAPYEEISKEEYENRSKNLKKIDFSKLIQYEQEDNTTGAKEFACVSGVCSIDDALAEEAKKPKGNKK